MTKSKALKKNAALRKAIDLGVRGLLAVAFALAAAGYLRGSFSHFSAIDWGHPQPELVGRALSVASICLYTIMIAALYLVRLPPVSSFAGVKPCVAALLGGFLMAALLFLEPRQDLPLWAEWFGFALVSIGNIFAVVALSQLGRSFSILPEGRRLVQAGVYAFIRHPLYLAEAIVSLGAMITFISPLAIAIVATQFGFQLLRMHYEEQVLRKNFPEYAAYAKRTARLIPRVY